jgi:hypothetical protein
MKRPILTILLLTSTLAFGQKFQDVTAKGSPVSLSVKADDPDMGPIVYLNGRTYAPLHGSPRFQNLTGRIGLPQPLRQI